MEGHAPYRGLLTHGFTVDGSGRKMSKSLGNWIALQDISKKFGAEIMRLWCASTDYSGDLAIDDKILARVVDAYRRIRNTLRFLLANTSDFDPTRRRAAGRLPRDRPLDRSHAAAAGSQEELAERAYEVYEFHPVVAKLQIFCSRRSRRVLPRRAEGPSLHHCAEIHARRSAQTALWHVTHAMLRWMAPFLSFTAEEAWKVFAPERSPSIFVETFCDSGGRGCGVAREVEPHPRGARGVNKEIEALRALARSVRRCRPLVICADGEV